MLLSPAPEARETVQEEAVGLKSLLGTLNNNHKPSTALSPSPLKIPPHPSLLICLLCERGRMELCHREQEMSLLALKISKAREPWGVHGDGSARTVTRRSHTEPPNLDISLPFPDVPCSPCYFFFWLSVGRSPWGAGSSRDEAFGERRQHREHSELPGFVR